jgi:hypothetical protein
MVDTPMLREAISMGSPFEPGTLKTVAEVFPLRELDRDISHRSGQSGR